MIDDRQKTDRNDNEHAKIVAADTGSYYPTSWKCIGKSNHRIPQFPDNVMLSTWCIVGRREELSAALESAALMQR